MLLHKIRRGDIECSELLEKLNFCVPRLNSRNTKTFYSTKANTNIVLYSPLNVMCSNANRISQSCDLFVCSGAEVVRAFLELSN